MADGLLQDLPRDLPTFLERFGTNEACRACLVRARWPAGLRCGGCGHGQAYSHKKRLIEECTACGKQHSILAGTIFEQTKTGLARWFLAIYLVTSSKGGISAMELQRQMGFGSYWHGLGAGCTRSAAPWSCRAASRSASGSRPTRPWSAALGPASPVAALPGKTVVAGAVESRRGEAQRSPARPPAAAGGARRLGQQSGRFSRPERPAPRRNRHRRLVGLSRPRGRGLRPRADPARPLLGRRGAPPAGDPPRLRARQALAARHPPWCGQRQAPAGLSRRVRLPLQPPDRQEHRPPLRPPHRAGRPHPTDHLPCPQPQQRLSVTDS